MQSYWHDRLGSGAAMVASEHGGATAMARRHGAALCSGAGEREARCESEVEQAAEARGLSFHVGLTDWTDADVRPQCSAPSLPRSASDAAMSAAIRPR